MLRAGLFLGKGSIQKMALKFSLSDRRNNKESLEQSLKYYSEKNLGPLQYLALSSL